MREREEREREREREREGDIYYIRRGSRKYVLGKGPLKLKPNKHQLKVFYTNYSLYFENENHIALQLYIFFLVSMNLT